MGSRPRSGKADPATFAIASSVLKVTKEIMLTLLSIRSTLRERLQSRTPGAQAACSAQISWTGHACAPHVDASFWLPPHHVSDKVLDFKVPPARPLPVTESGSHIAEVPVQLHLCELRRVAEVTVPFTFIVRTKKTSGTSQRAGCLRMPSSRSQGCARKTRVRQLQGETHTHEPRCEEWPNGGPGSAHRDP